MRLTLRSNGAGRICTDPSQVGDTIDFHLSPTRNTKAAKGFLGKALDGLKVWQHPLTINTDKAPAYGLAIAALKTEGNCA